jgi:hypothetical protein
MSPLVFEPVRICSPRSWLAGVYAPAPRPQAALLVIPPFPHEWQRGYRLFALLAHALTALGISCLRFDATGCGDTPGDDSEFCLSQLQADSELALAWLRVQSPAPVRLLGVRAGALVASSLAAREGLDWVGWQPIESGADYLDALEERETRELRNVRRFGARLPAQGRDDSCLLGSRIHPELRKELRSAHCKLAAQTSLDADLPEGLKAWVEEIDLVTPFALPQVRAVAATLARQLGTAA